MDRKDIIISNLIDYIRECNDSTKYTIYVAEHEIGMTKDEIKRMCPDLLKKRNYI